MFSPELPARTLPRIGDAWRKDVVICRRALRLCAAERFGRGTPVLIYQMGKVGSTSIQRSLRRCVPDGVGPIFRIHVLSPDNLHLLYPRHVDLRHPVVCADRQRYGLFARQLRRYVLVKRKPVKVITPVREPIARNISLFFENLFEFHLPPGARLDCLTTHELTEIFLSQVRHSVASDWFDLEMRQTLGIDVYAYPFPREKGYLHIREGNVDLLLLKLEMDDCLKERAIADFLSLEWFELESSNMAQQKPYASAYQEFVGNVTLPAWYVEAMTCSAYTRHFYSVWEIEQMWDRWM